MSWFPIRLLRHLAAVSSFCIGMAACGGGGGDSAPPASGGGGGGGGGSGSVATAPSITTQPRDVTVAAGQTATFTVSAAGTATLQYQWMRDGTAIGGATAASHTTPALSAADNGATFSVQVSNSAGSVTSNLATLTVTAAGGAISGHFVAEVGAKAQAVASFVERSRSVRTGRLVVFDGARPTRQAVLEAAGAWLPETSFHQADFNTTTGTFSGLRERWRVYLRNGRIYKLDLASAAALPAPVQLSSLSLLDLCPDYVRSFEDWQFPDRSVLVYSAPATAGGGCNGALVYRALRLDMGPTDAAVTIARPVDALRDRLGSITGFVLQNGDTLTQVDAAFGNARTAHTNTDGSVRLAGVGIYGAPGAPYLLFQEIGFSTAATFGIRLQAGAPVLALTGASSALGGLSTLVRDASGLYFMDIAGSNVRLWHVANDLTPRIVAQGLPSYTTQLVLTPTRVVMAIENGTLVSIPKAGGSASSIGSFIGTGGDDTVVAVGEDVYFKPNRDAFANGVEVVRSDGTQRLALPGLRIQGTLAAATQSVAALAQGRFVDLSFALNVVSQFGADQPAAVVMSDHAASGGYSLSRARLVRFGSDRTRADYGALPLLLQALDGAEAAPPPVGGNLNGDLRAERPIGARGAAAWQASMPGTFGVEGNDVFLFQDGAAGLTRVTNVGL